MNKEQHLEQFHRLSAKARKLKLPSIDKSIKLAEEKIKNNIYWRSRSYYNLQDWLEKLVHDLHINIV